MEVSEKRDAQVGNLAAWVERLRPMRVRKVDGSGTNGVGSGIGGWRLVRRAWRCRLLIAVDGGVEHGRRREASIVAVIVVVAAVIDGCWWR